MRLQQLADELREMYDTAPRGEQVVMIHLFGIKYAAEFKGLPLAKIVDLAGLPHTYVTEINKGRNLAKYVDLKPQVINHARQRFLS